MKNNTTFYVDFKNRTLLSKKEEFFIEEKNEENFSLKYFNKPPLTSNFRLFSDKDRFDHSQHILNHFKDFSFDDILYFIEMGVLDKNEVSKKINIPFTFEEENVS